MKKTIISYLVLFLALGCMSATAQQRGQIRVIPKNLEQRGDKLRIEMEFDMSELRMKSTETRVYTPILTSGNKTYEMPKVIIKGRRRFKADRREEALSGRPTATLYTPSHAGKNALPAVYAIGQYNKKERIPYLTSIPYSEWMSDAMMDLREEVSGCCGKPQSATVIKNVFGEVEKQAYDIRPQFRYLEPAPEPTKRRFEIGNAYLDFPQGKSVIDPYFRNNRSELDKINQMINLVSNDADVTVNSVEMRGWASPESSQSFNYSLSSARAEAMRDYFARNSSIPSSYFRVGAGGEDWETLKQLLVSYPVSYQSQIINIINTVYDLDRREKAIKELGGGQPYRQIFRDLYPKLRRVDCQVNYTVRSFTLDEGKERIHKKPKLLSQNEMYQVARTYPEGSSEFNETMLTARKYFPGDDVANLNGAAAALTQGNLDLAEEYLNQVQNINSAEYANCLGVLYTYRGNYDLAERYLRQAQDAGLTEATYNLRELQKRRGSAPAKTRRKAATTNSSSYRSNSNSRSTGKTVKINGEIYVKEQPSD